MSAESVEGVVVRRQVRVVFERDTDSPVVELALGERILCAEHEGRDWWVYVEGPAT